MESQKLLLEVAEERLRIAAVLLVEREELLRQMQGNYSVGTASCSLLPLSPVHRARLLSRFYRDRG